MTDTTDFQERVADLSSVIQEAKTDNINALLISTAEADLILELIARLSESQQETRDAASEIPMEEVVRYAELEQERDALKQEVERLNSLWKDEDSPLFTILLEVYGATNGKEWTVYHRLMKVLRQTHRAGG